MQGHHLDTRQLWVLLSWKAFFWLIRPQISKVYPYSLRPVVIITSCLGLGWGVALGVISLQDRGDQFGRSSLNPRCGYLIKIALQKPRK